MRTAKLIRATFRGTFCVVRAGWWPRGGPISAAPRIVLCWQPENDLRFGRAGPFLPAPPAIICRTYSGRGVRLTKAHGWIAKDLGQFPGDQARSGRSRSRCTKQRNPQTVPMRGLQLVCQVPEGMCNHVQRSRRPLFPISDNKPVPSRAGPPRCADCLCRFQGGMTARCDLEVAQLHRKTRPVPSGTRSAGKRCKEVRVALPCRGSRSTLFPAKVPPDVSASQPCSTSSLGCQLAMVVRSR